jgi:hypothetical protein
MRSFSFFFLPLCLTFFLFVLNFFHGTSSLLHACHIGVIFFSPFHPVFFFFIFDLKLLTDFGKKLTVERRKSTRVFFLQLSTKEKLHFVFRTTPIYSAAKRNHNIDRWGNFSIWGVTDVVVITNKYLVCILSLKKPSDLPQFRN